LQIRVIALEEATNRRAVDNEVSPERAAAVAAKLKGVDPAHKMTDFQIDHRVVVSAVARLGAHFRDAVRLLSVRHKPFIGRSGMSAPHSQTQLGSL